MAAIEIEPHTIFTGVVSSTPLTEDGVAEFSGCPREALGLACLVPAYPCLCAHVSAWTVETTKNEDGETAVLALGLRLVPGVRDAAAVMNSLDLTGYKADMAASRDAVTAAFRLSRPQNLQLKSYVLESA